MKLRPIIPTRKETFNAAPRIQFNSGGYLTINPAAVERYGFKEGDHIVIVHDDDKPGDFYLVVTKDTNMPKLKKAGKTSLKAGYAAAFKEICVFHQIPSQPIKINLAGQVKTELGTAICMLTGPLKELGNKIPVTP